MTLRDLPDSVRRRLAMEGDDEYEQWISLTQGLSFNTKEPIPLKVVWRTAFSKGVLAALKRVDKLKD